LSDAFSERGLSPGQKLEILFRYAKGVPAALPGLAAELVRQKPDLLIGIGGDVAVALFKASEGNIPVVAGVSDNPLRAGLAKTLAKPGTNFTGVTFLTDELAGKRMEFLNEVAPTSKRPAVIWNPQHMDDEFVFARRAAEKLGLVLTSHEISSIDALDGALRDATAVSADSLFVIPSRLTSMAAPEIAHYALEKQLPVMTAWREFVAAGCLLSYGPNRKAQAKRLVECVSRIMTGTNPADIPIEQPTKFELVINLRTAKALGLTIPPAFITRADDVIE
jgi:putative ABC transport system substrate-binding protein